MENFKKTLQKRLGLVAVYNVVVIAFLAFGIYNLVTGNNDNTRDFISGFNMGICVGVEVVMMYYAGKYLGALKNEEKLKKLYVEENDERTLFIETKIGGAAINIVICGIILATIVSGYFNETVFFTLLGVTVFSTLVKLILKAYYNKKF